MNLARRHHYLGAMGIDIWVPRRTATRASEAAHQPARSEETAALQPGTVLACGSAIAGRVVLGPGAGSTLLLCGKPGEAATAVAADIARSLGNEPVWSWLAQDEAAPGMPLEQAIEERLFTRVLVFGRDLFAPAADSAVQVIGSARLVRVESIPVLVQSGAARRALWLALNEY
jgi:hypothetical protein